MAAIVPAILPVSQEDLEDKLAALVGLVDSVQIDIVDGRFISPASWPYRTESDKGLPSFAGKTFSHLGQIHYEMDLMVSAPEDVAGTWVEAGADRITLHVESTNYLPKTITDLEVRYGHAKDFAPELLAIGIALNIQSDLAIIEPYMAQIDYVQFMGIATIGKQGEPFDTRVLQKIATFKKKHPEIPVQVDGGVSLQTAPALLSAGVERLIVGSALWNAPDLATELQKFNELLHQYGIYT
ncbi:hypothetical protein H0X32_03910 [Patescibacteria group bacterium]|nr:hypothetical protein [Patescibacteria group bacterium]